MKKIPLHSKKYPGLFALVDDADYPWLMQFCWSPNLAAPGRFYAETRTGGHRVYMHKLLTGYRETDHRDRDSLNNQRSNLRDTSRQQNLANRGKYRRDPHAASGSKYKGVHYHGEPQRVKRWQATITVNGKQKSLGYFCAEEGAAFAYDRAAREYFGEYACTNFDLAA